jgi:hypothetical protein
VKLDNCLFLNQLRGYCNAKYSKLFDAPAAAQRELSCRRRSRRRGCSLACRGTTLSRFFRPPDVRRQPQQAARGARP